MSRQLIRHYYPDGEGLMIAVCDALAAAHREALTRGIVEAEVSKRLPLFLDLFFNILAGDGLRKPQDDRAYDAVMSLATSSELVRKCLAEQQSLLQFTIAHEVQISHPELSQAACKEIGFLFIALLYGHWRMVASLGFSERYNAISRAAVDRLIASYLAHYQEPEDTA